MISYTFKSLLRVKPMIFLLISFIYQIFQMFTLAQPHDFSSFSYMIYYKFKLLLSAKDMIFLLISFIYQVFQRFTLAQHRDFSFISEMISYILKSLLGAKPMIFLPAPSIFHISFIFFLLWSKPMIFLLNFFVSWISNLYLGPTLWSFSFSYIIQDKSKPLLCAKPMIFLSSFFVNRYKFMIFLLFQLINQQIILHFGKGLSFFCSFFNNL